MGLNVNSSGDIAQYRNQIGESDEQAKEIERAGKDLSGDVSAVGGKISDSIGAHEGHKGDGGGKVDPKNPFDKAADPSQLNPDVITQSSAWFGAGANVGALVAIQRAVLEAIKADKSSIQTETKLATQQQLTGFKNALDARERSEEGAKDLISQSNMALGMAVAGGVASAAVAFKQVSNYSKTAAEAKAGGTMIDDGAGNRILKEDTDAWKRGELRGAATTTTGQMLNTTTGAVSQNMTTQGQADNQMAQAQSEVDKTASQMQIGNAEKARDAQKAQHEATLNMIDSMMQSASKVADANAAVKI